MTQPLMLRLSSVIWLKRIGELGHDNASAWEMRGPDVAMTKCLFLAYVRRSQQPPSWLPPMDSLAHNKLLRFDRFVLDLTRGCLRAGKQEIHLRPKAFRLLT